ncbi:MAG: hypothetical protein A6F71_05850 [Cycloclasticus sp. symbiont of Poecilosclerida sp. M]|nr:MAG: hypothetical protein A6F71_05850 [Cycloclasticus sp. symbiont of Poecilosclerida sp. M]
MLQNCFLPWQITPEVGQFIPLKTVLSQSSILLSLPIQFIDVRSLGAAPSWKMSALTARAPERERFQHDLMS